MKALDLSGDHWQDEPFDVTRETLDRWTPFTGLSGLPTLILGIVTPGAFRWLRAQTMMNLVSLQIILFPGFGDEFSAMLRGLRPLQELIVDGCFSEGNLVALTEQQKKSDCLRRLPLQRAPSSTLLFDVRRIWILPEHCSNIEVLHLTTERTLGDKDEAEIHRCLGSFPRLRDLRIELDCALFVDEGEEGEDVGLMETWFEDFESEIFAPRRGYRTSDLRLRNGHVMKRIINLAIDKALAVSIWDAIAAGKPYGSAPLESLKLRPNTELSARRCEYPSDIYKITKYLGLSWNVNRSLRDDDTGPTVTVPRRRQLRELRDMDLDGNFTQLEPNVAEILGRIWPGIICEGNRWEHREAFWSSRPTWNEIPTMLRIPWY